MKTTSNVRRKKVFPALLLLLVLTVALSVGTTLGKYYKKIPIPDSELDTGELNVELILYDIGEGGDSAPDEGPGIEEQAPVTVYQVQSGDTLSSIAEKFHTTAQALAAYNKLEDPNLLYPGMILRIPPEDYVVPEDGTEKTPSAEPAEESQPTPESQLGEATGQAPIPPESVPSEAIIFLTSYRPKRRKKRISEDCFLVDQSKKNHGIPICAAMGMP